MVPCFVAIQILLLIALAENHAQGLSVDVEESSGHPFRFPFPLPFEAAGVDGGPLGAGEGKIHSPPWLVSPSSDAAAAAAEDDADSTFRRCRT
jgi:hypothetical protein